MTEPVRIRVWMEGPEARYDLMIDGSKVRDLDYQDVFNLALSAFSSIRWVLPHNRK
jgi:hypothetical protein